MNNKPVDSLSSVLNLVKQKGKVWQLALPQAEATWCSKDVNSLSAGRDWAAFLSAVYIACSEFRFCSSPTHQTGSSKGYRACFVLISPFVILHKSSSAFQNNWLELASLIVAAHADVNRYCSLKDGLKKCKRQKKQLISPIQTRLLWEGGADRVVDVSWRSRRSRFNSTVDSPFSSLADYHSS